MEDYNEEFDVDEELPEDLVDTREYGDICFHYIHNFYLSSLTCYFFVINISSYNPQGTRCPAERAP